MDGAKFWNQGPSRHGVIVTSDTRHAEHLTGVLKQIGLEVETYADLAGVWASPKAGRPPILIVIDRLPSSRDDLRSAYPPGHAVISRTSVLVVAAEGEGGIHWRIVETGGGSGSEPVDEARLAQLFGILLDKADCLNQAPVLIIAADRHRQSFLAQPFKEDGSEVIVASSRARALALLKKREPGLIFLDMTWPEGEREAGALRRRYPWTGIVVLIPDGGDARPDGQVLGDAVVSAGADPQDLFFLGALARDRAAAHALNLVSREMPVGPEKARRPDHTRRDSEDIFEIIDHPAMIIDPEYRILAANRVTRQAFGGTEELSGRACYTVMHGSSGPPPGCPLKRMLASGQVEIGTMPVELLGGYFLVSCTPIREEGERPRRILHIATDITELRRAEEQLKQSEEKYRQIFANALEGIFQTTPEGSYVSINPAFATMFGYASPQEMMTAIRDIGGQVYVRPADRERMKGLLTRNGYVEGYEAEVYRKDGTKIWININAHVVRDAHGEIRFYEGTNVDISARKRTEQALSAILNATLVNMGHDYFPSLTRELSAALGVRYAFVGELIPGRPGYIRTVAFWAGGEAAANRTYALSGTPCEAVLTTGLCLFPQDLQTAFPQDEDLKALGAASYMGIPLSTGGQEVLGILAVMDDKPMEQGELARTLLTIFATRAGAELERVRTDAALQESEARYRYLVENSHELVAEIGNNRQYFYISPNHREILGYERDELMRVPITAHLHPDDLPGVLSKLELQSGTAVFRFQHKDGSWRWLEASGRRFLNPGGEEHIVIVSRDITERIQAEQERQSLQEQLALSQKMESIGRLAGGVAHDFNNLLTPILGYAEMLLNDLPYGDVRQEQVLQIREAAERAKDLTRQLLVFSRKQELELKNVDLGKSLVRFQKLLRSTIREDIWITVHVAPLLGLIRADIGQIEQVLMNLAVNAQDAMPTGGLFTIELKNVSLDERFAKRYPGTKPGPHVLLTVSDTGGGMDDDTIKHLFEPFYTTKTSGQGTGLGLSIVHGIIKQHGGVITCESAPGRGTTFKIYLPRLEESVTQPSPDAPGLSVFKRGTETVLIVDDNRAVRDLASRILSQQGYRVIVAEDTQQCLEIADQRDRINLLLTDLIMPVMNGRELYERLHSAQPHLKVVYMSSYPGEIIDRHGVSPEDASFLQKPFTIKTLSDKVRDVLDASATRPPRYV